MAKSWTEIEGALKAQRTGMRILLQHSGVAMVKFRYKGEFISAELLDGKGAAIELTSPCHAGHLREIAAAQLSANPGGQDLWQRSAGVLEWILDGDTTIAWRNHPGSDHDLVMGEDLRELTTSAANDANDADGACDTEAERPRMMA